MDKQLSRIFGLTDEPAYMQQSDMVIDPAPSGRALRRAMIKSDPWFRAGDIRDGIMTFCLVFVGAMMFLID